MKLLDTFVDTVDLGRVVGVEFRGVSFDAGEKSETRESYALTLAQAVHLRGQLDQAIHRAAEVITWPERSGESAH